VVSEERINKVAETYRGIRNALRYQLSNLYDFDPAKQSVPDDKLTGLDRWILGEFAKVEKEVGEAYDKYEFHVVYQKLSQFIAVELSSIYHDVIKDRLYTDAANSHRRRSTQTALHRLVTGLCKMLAPVLAFTADEAWEFVPGKTVESIHAMKWEPCSLKLSDESDLNSQHIRDLLDYRHFNVLSKLEEARQQKRIGKSLDAIVTIRTNLLGDALLLEKTTGSEAFRELLNVSGVIIEPLNTSGHSVVDEVNVVPASETGRTKCERCWHWETDVGSTPEHPTICARCVEAVKQAKG
jgi:isoleucyl-tRNA synthetase